MQWVLGSGVSVGRCLAPCGKSLQAVPDGWPQIQYNNSVCVLAHSMTPGCPPDCPGTFLGSGLDLGGDPLRTHEAEIVLNSCFVTKQSGRMK